MPGTFLARVLHQFFDALFRDMPDQRALRCHRVQTMSMAKLAHTRQQTFVELLLS